MLKWDISIMKSIIYISKYLYVPSILSWFSLAEIGKHNTNNRNIASGLVEGWLIKIAFTG